MRENKEVYRQPGHSQSTSSDQWSGQSHQCAYSNRARERERGAKKYGSPTWTKHRQCSSFSVQSLPSPSPISDHRPPPPPFLPSNISQMWCRDCLAKSLLFPLFLALLISCFCLHFPPSLPLPLLQEILQVFGLEGSLFNHVQMGKRRESGF